MDIRPILQTFRFNKGSLALVTIQIAFTLAVLVNTLLVIDIYRARVNLDTGIDDRAIIAADVEPIDRAYFSDEGRVRNDIQQDMDALRRIEGVRQVAQINSFPLSGEGVMRPSWPVGTQKEKAVRHTVYAGDGGALDALGLRLVAGRGFTDQEMNWLADPLGGERASVIIVSRDLADMLFPGENALGRQIETEDGKVDTIIGLVDRLPGRHILMGTIKLAAIVPAQPLGAMRYAVGTEGAATPELIERVNQALYQRDTQRHVVTDTLRARKTRSMHFLYLFGSILGFIGGILLVVTAIGAYSQASYSVTKRFKQIGTRRAFGASRLHILRYFLTENWLSTTMGLLFGLLIANGLSFVLTQAVELPRIGWGHLLLGMFFLWGVGLLATLYPALRATLIPPALATRSAA